MLSLISVAYNAPGCSCRTNGTEAVRPAGPRLKNSSKIYTKNYARCFQANDAVCFKRMPKSKAS